MTPPASTGILAGIDLAPALSGFISDASGMLTSVIPIGVGFLLVMAAPRIIRRIIGAFI